MCDVPLLPMVQVYRTRWLAEMAADRARELGYLALVRSTGLSGRWRVTLQFGPSQVAG